MNGVCNSIALVNGHRVRDTVAEHRRKDGPRRIVAREARLALPEPVSIINAVDTSSSHIFVSLVYVFMFMCVCVFVFDILSKNRKNEVSGKSKEFDLNGTI